MTTTAPRFGAWIALPSAIAAEQIARQAILRLGLGGRGKGQQAEQDAPQAAASTSVWAKSSPL